jgi:membrane protein DedA with SNARE-associated domain
MLEGGRRRAVFSEELIRDWGCLGVFIWIVATGLGLPCPEEVPVILGGVFVGHPGSQINMALMLTACFLGVIVGDGLLYGIGRLWGPRILEFAWVKKHVLPPERLERIESNFHKYGIKILLFARLTPGIRAPIFVTAGITRVPLIKFLIADGIYAIPGVTLLFFLGYWFTDQLNAAWLQQEATRLKSILILVVILAVGAYFAYRFLRRPQVTGDPEEMPPLVDKVTSKIMHRGPEGPAQPADKLQEHGAAAPPGGNGDGHAPADPLGANPEKTAR